MAQYEPFAPGVEVNGETVLATVNAFPEVLRSQALRLLADKGIKDPKPGEWYSQAIWLETFREIATRFGTNTLFGIGKAIPANAIFPPEIDSIEKAMEAIDVAYNMNHRNGDIGFYKLVSHDAAKKEIIMHCKNPYPCDFDRGIITTMGRKFCTGVIVKVDSSKPSRNEGAEDSWYVVSYN